MWANALLPQFAMKRARSLDDRIVAIRLVFCSFVGLAVVGTIVGLALGSISGSAPVPVPLATGSVVVIAALTVFRRVGRSRRSLGCGNPEEVAVAYYVRFLKEMALVAFITPWAVMAALASLSVLPALMGLVGSGVALVVVAPTADQLRRDAEALRADGCDVDLVAALRGR
jgi:hypothetical protein